MNKLLSIFAIVSGFLANSPFLEAHYSNAKDHTCNGSHSDKYIGVYYRSDVTDGRLQTIPVITLNKDGTAIVYFGEALDLFGN